MPFVVINTNVEKSDIADVNDKLATMSKTLGEVYEVAAPLFILINGGCPIIQGGDSTTPAAFLRVSAPDCTREKAEKVVAGICQMVKDNLNVPLERVSIEFHEWEKKCIGANGKMVFKHPPE